MEALNPEFRLREGTHNQIIGKTVGQTFPDMKNVLGGIENKMITYAKEFKSTGSFSAIGEAKKYLSSEGYVNGSMYMDYPIGFIKKGKFGYEDNMDIFGNSDTGDVIPNNQPKSSLIITKHGEERPMITTKWDRLGYEQIDELDGVILSQDFRDGDVYVIFFVFPE